MPDADRSSAPYPSRANGPCSPLVLHHGALGDSVQLVAMLDELRRRWGAACDLVAGRVSPALFAGLDSVREVQVLGSRSTPYALSRRQRQLVEWMRRRGPSPCYVVERWRHPVAPWSRSTRLEWLARRAGIAAESTVTTERVIRAPLEHAVDYFVRLARLDPPALAAPFAGGSGAVRPRLAVTADEIAEGRDRLREMGWRGESIVLFQPLSRRKKRGRWPEERWIELLHRLRAERPRAWFGLLGGPSERAETARLALRVSELGVHDLAVDLPLRRLMATLTLAESLVSLDTGPAHIAAALGCPVVVLLGSADPRRNRPLGEPGTVELVSTFGERLPLDGAEWFARHRVEAIEVDAVFAAWQRLRFRAGSAGVATSDAS